MDFCRKLFGLLKLLFLSKHERIRRENFLPYEKIRNYKIRFTSYVLCRSVQHTSVEGKRIFSKVAEFKEGR